MLTKSERQTRDKLLENNYENAKTARDKSEMEKHNRDFKSLMNYAMSKVPSNERKRAEASLTPESGMKYGKMTNEIQAVMSKPQDKDISDITKFGNLKFDTFKDTYASKPIK